MKKALIVATVGGFLPQFEMSNVHLLQKLGYEIHYASNFKNCIYEFNEKEMETNGIILHQVDILKNPFRLVSLRRAIKKIKSILNQEQIQLIHCHTPIGSVVARIAAQKARIKPYVIYTAHGFHFYKGAPIFNWIVYFPVEYLLSKYTDCLITINGEDYMRSLKMLCPRCRQIPGVGLNTARFFPDKTAASEIAHEQGEHKLPFHMISVGELNRNKNHEIVIKAVARLKDVDISYDIYGEGKEKEHLEKLIKKYDLEEKVKLRGYTCCVEQYLREADCFVFPSIREGLGLAALEAMACGLPVIAADNRGTREYMRNGVNGIVCGARDIDAFARAIRTLMENTQLRCGMGDNARKTARNFTKEISQKIMREVYGQI